MCGGGITNNNNSIAKWEKANVRKEDDSKTLEELKKPLENDGKDNIIVQDKDGHRFTITSNQIKYQNGQLPKVNTNISFVENKGTKFVNVPLWGKVMVDDNPTLEGKVVYADNEVPSEPEKLQIAIPASLSQHFFSIFYDDFNKGDVREIRNNVTDKDLYSVLKTSNLDAIVLKTEEGKRFVIYHADLELKNGKKLPDIGSKVEIGGIVGELTHLNFLGKAKEGQYDYSSIENLSFVSEEAKKATKDVEDNYDIF